MTVAAILLAAGGGTRFRAGGHKLVADLHGRPVVAWSLQAAADAGFDEVLVVTGAIDLGEVVAEIARSSSTPIRVVHNPDWSTGQASSLRAGVNAAAAAGHRAVVVGLGDQPAVGPSPWRTVGAARGQIVAATFDGRRRPPVKLDRSVWALLPETGDDGARLLMGDHPELVAEVPCTGNPYDIDTQQDLSVAPGPADQWP